VSAIRIIKHIDLPGLLSGTRNGSKTVRTITVGIFSRNRDPGALTSESHT